MNYYEITNPYYALVKADTKEDAVKEYIENVAGDEGESQSLLKEFKAVPEYYAVARFSRTKGENDELMEIEEVLETLGNEKPEVLLIDGSLV